MKKQTTMQNYQSNTFGMKISMIIAFTLGPKIILAQYCLWRRNFKFSFFEAPNDKYEAKYFHSSFFTPHQIF